MISNFPPGQEAIRARCFHPTGRFTEFREAEVEQSVPQRFEKIAEQYPDRIAIRAENHSIAYQELREISNRIGRLILARPSLKGAPIGLLFGHGIEFVTAILGVLKAGSIYVPLDPTFPFERLKFMLDDSDANLILTDTANVALAAPRRRVVNVDHFAEVAAYDLEITSEAETLAYIMYTSGSTGRPKGVMQTHRNVLHRAMIGPTATAFRPQTDWPFSSPAASAPLRGASSARCSTARCCFRMTSSGPRDRV